MNEARASLADQGFRLGRSGSGGFPGAIRPTRNLIPRSRSTVRRHTGGFRAGSSSPRGGDGGWPGDSLPFRGGPAAGQDSGTTGCDVGRGWHDRQPTQPPLHRPHGM